MKPRQTKPALEVRFFAFLYPNLEQLKEVAANIIKANYGQEQADRLTANLKPMTTRKDVIAAMRAVGIRVLT